MFGRTGKRCEGDHVAAAVAACVQVLEGRRLLSGSTSEGSEYQLDLRRFAPTADEVLEYVVDWGDGSSSGTINARDLLPNRTIAHTYVEGPAEHTISVDLLLADGTRVDDARPVRAADHFN